MQTVCLVGKPNVGKSSIFNRLIKEKKAIIMDTPGVTRDRIYGIVNYKGKKFHLIDTGGIILNKNILEKDIAMQVKLAISEANIVLFVVDGLNDLDVTDFHIRDLIRKSNKKVIVVVNKIDNIKRKENIYNYYELGFANVISVSAEHNIGFNDLLEEITKDMEVINQEEDLAFKFSIVGRPNVGKSSLVNAILNKEQVLVDDISGTTRDAIDTKFIDHGKTYTIIDTAGMRKKGKIYENIEKYSLVRSLKAIDRSDVCVLVLDAKEGIIEHDKHIASYVLAAGKGLVIAVNKWDTIKNHQQELKTWQEKISTEFQFLPYVKTVFLSALNKKNVSSLLPEIITAYENNQKTIKTSVLNKIITAAVNYHNPPSYKGQRLKIYFVSQTGIKPPKITLQVNNKNLVHFSYQRYLENKIREEIDLTGTPIILQFKNKNNPKI